MRLVWCLALVALLALMVEPADGFVGGLMQAVSAAVKIGKKIRRHRTAKKALMSSKSHVLSQHKGVRTARHLKPSKVSQKHGRRGVWSRTKSWFSRKQRDRKMRRQKRRDRRRKRTDRKKPKLRSKTGRKVVKKSKRNKDEQLTAKSKSSSKHPATQGKKDQAKQSDRASKRQNSATPTNKNQNSQSSLNQAQERKASSANEVAGSAAQQAPPEAGGHKPWFRDSFKDAVVQGVVGGTISAGVAKAIDKIADGNSAPEAPIAKPGESATAKRDHPADSSVLKTTGFQKGVDTSLKSLPSSSHALEMAGPSGSTSSKTGVNTSLSDRASSSSVPDGPGSSDTRSKKEIDTGLASISSDSSILKVAVPADDYQEVVIQAIRCAPPGDGCAGTGESKMTSKKT